MADTQTVRAPGNYLRLTFGSGDEFASFADGDVVVDEAKLLALSVSDGTYTWYGRRLFHRNTPRVEDGTIILDVELLPVLGSDGKPHASGWLPIAGASLTITYAAGLVTDSGGQGSFGNAGGSITNESCMHVLDSDGWQQFSIADDAVVVYIDPTGGNDGTAVVYDDIDDADIGGDWNSPSAEKAYQTVNAAWLAWRAYFGADLNWKSAIGHGVLFHKRGETINIGSTNNITFTATTHGTSATSPLLLLPYGSGALPVVVKNGTKTYQVQSGQYVFIAGIDFDDNSLGYSISSNAPAKGLVFEGCAFGELTFQQSLDDDANGYGSCVMRRCSSTGVADNPFFPNSLSLYIMDFVSVFNGASSTLDHGIYAKQLVDSMIDGYLAYDITDSGLKIQGAFGLTVRDYAAALCGSLASINVNGGSSAWTFGAPTVAVGVEFYNAAGTNLKGGDGASGSSDNECTGIYIWSNQLCRVHDVVLANHSGTSSSNALSVFPGFDSPEWDGVTLDTVYSNLVIHNAVTGSAIQFTNHPYHDIGELTIKNSIVTADETFAGNEMVIGFEGQTYAERAAWNRIYLHSISGGSLTGDGSTYLDNGAGATATINEVSGDGRVAYVTVTAGTFSASDTLTEKEVSGDAATGVTGIIVEYILLTGNWTGDPTGESLSNGGTFSADVVGYVGGTDDHVYLTNVVLGDLAAGDTLTSSVNGYTATPDLPPFEPGAGQPLGTPSMASGDLVITDLVVNHGGTSTPFYDGAESSADQSASAFGSLVDGDIYTNAITYVDSSRDFDAYAALLGYGSTSAFADAALAQCAYGATWDDQLTGRAANRWIRAGFVASIASSPTPADAGVFGLAVSTAPSSMVLNASGDTLDITFPQDMDVTVPSPETGIFVRVYSYGVSVSSGAWQSSTVLRLTLAKAIPDVVPVASIDVRYEGGHLVDFDGAPVPKWAAVAITTNNSTVDEGKVLDIDIDTALSAVADDAVVTAGVLGINGLVSARAGTTDDERRCVRTLETSEGTGDTTFSPQAAATVAGLSGDYYAIRFQARPKLIGTLSGDVNVNTAYRFSNPVEAGIRLKYNDHGVGMNASSTYGSLADCTDSSTNNSNKMLPWGETAEFVLLLKRYQSANSDQFLGMFVNGHNVGAVSAATQQWSINYDYPLRFEYDAAVRWEVWGKIEVWDTDTPEFLDILRQPADAPFRTFQALPMDSGFFGIGQTVVSVSGITYGFQNQSLSSRGVAQVGNNAVTLTGGTDATEEIVFRPDDPLEFSAEGYLSASMSQINASAAGVSQFAVEADDGTEIFGVRFLTDDDTYEKIQYRVNAGAWVTHVSSETDTVDITDPFVIRMTQRESDGDFALIIRQDTQGSRAWTAQVSSGVTTAFRQARFLRTTGTSGGSEVTTRGMVVFDQRPQAACYMDSWGSGTSTTNPFTQEPNHNMVYVRGARVGERIPGLPVGREIGTGEYWAFGVSGEAEFAASGRSIETWVSQTPGLQSLLWGHTVVIGLSDRNTTAANEATIIAGGAGAQAVLDNFVSLNIEACRNLLRNGCYVVFIGYQPRPTADDGAYTTDPALKQFSIDANAAISAGLRKLSFPNTSRLVWCDPYQEALDQEIDPQGTWSWDDAVGTHISGGNDETNIDLAFASATLIPSADDEADERHRRFRILGRL